MGVEDVNRLWLASAALGVAYGGMFGLFPTVTIDWFGLSEYCLSFESSPIHSPSAHFSENWGVLCLAPLFGGNAFSVMFGRNLDAHETEGPPQHSTNPNSSVASTLAALAKRAGLPSERQCFDGRDCYIASIYVTLAACVLALALSIWAAVREKRQQALKMHDEVLWEEREDLES